MRTGKISRLLHSLVYASNVNYRWSIGRFLDSIQPTQRCQCERGNGSIQWHFHIEAIRANETCEMWLQGMDAG